MQNDFFDKCAVAALQALISKMDGAGPILPATIQRITAQALEIAKAMDEQAPRPMNFLADPTAEHSPKVRPKLEDVAKLAELESAAEPDGKKGWVLIYEVYGSNGKRLLATDSPFELINFIKEKTATGTSKETTVFSTWIGAEHASRWAAWTNPQPHEIPL